LSREALAVLSARINPAAVIVSDRTAEIVPAGTPKTIRVEEIEEGFGEGEFAAALKGMPRPRLGDLAFLQHSSGTTGHKKGVMLTHAQILEQERLYSGAIGISGGDVVASWLPLYHDMGLITSFLIPAIIGCPIVSLDALEWVLRPAMLLDQIERHRAKFTWLPNFAFHHICRGDPEPGTRDLTSLKAIINCSEPCRAATFELFADRYASAGVSPDKLQVCYAMAENVFAVTQTPATQPARVGRSEATKAYLSCGTPLPGVELRVVSPAGDIMPDGAFGEICIRTTCLFDGYYRLPELSNERLIEGWYHTRDLGCIQDGELFVIGRTDDLLIINGRNIFAHEVEDLLNDVDGVVPGRVIVHGEYDVQLSATRLLVLAELADDSDDEKAIAAQIRSDVFSRCGIFPGAIRFVPRGFLVKSTSGKLSREQSYRKYRQDLHR
jgi:acyl-CoA synthetase (AMP-forming)/AMP-acid ligase II